MANATPSSVRVVLPGDGIGEPVRWAAGELLEALAARGVAAELGGAEGGFSIRASIGGARPEGAREGGPEAFSLVPDAEGILAWGQDGRGLVYALTELADRVRHEADSALFGEAVPTHEQTAARVRSVARLFCSDTEDLGWFRDRGFWRSYLDMLVTNRFNRVSLTLGLAYNYPYHNHYITDVYFYFPYPFLVDVPGYDVSVVGLGNAERAANLAALKFIGAEAARRGLDFQLALWTQRYDFDDVPRANYAIRGVTAENFAGYCRDALTLLLREVPEITGLTFRVHVEGGIAEGDYPFWEQAFAGVAAAGRAVEIDMHAKGLDERMIAVARASGMPVATSPKYMAEHMGFAYHMSAIRDREYPPEHAGRAQMRFSEGSRKFLRYSYGDLLAKDRDWRVVFRIWAGTQRLLLWGDPAMAGGYGRSAAFCGADGVEVMEPGSLKGRMGTGIPGQRTPYRRQELATRYDFQKYEYYYRVWGRRVFDPACGRDGWMRFLRTHCGAAAEACEAALAFSSRVLPLFTLAHAPSASYNWYWPEIYTVLPVGTDGHRGPYGYDMDGDVRFGNASTFDTQLFANPKQYVASLYAGETDRRYSPLDVACWFDALAAGCEQALAAMRGTADFARGEVQRIATDVAILSGMARFFAARFRASVWVELFLLAKASVTIDHAHAWLLSGLAAWRGVAAAGDAYQDDLTFGPQPFMRGSWGKRLQAIEDEALNISSIRAHQAPYATIPPDEGTARAMAAIAAWRETPRGGVRVSAAPIFAAGAPLAVTAAVEGEAPILHYRHVNQAERWQAMPMQAAGEGYAATIPGEYTRSPFHLQFYVSAVADGAVRLGPGLDADFANEPYLTALQQ